jgi:hypothetical protein
MLRNINIFNLDIKFLQIFIYKITQKTNGKNNSIKEWSDFNTHSW